jgi:hypothetical protein
MIQSYGVRKPWATGIILSNYVRQLPKENLNTGMSLIDLGGYKLI